MPQVKNQKNCGLFILDDKKFLLLCAVLFCLLFSASAFFYSEQIYLFMLRKYYVAEIEREFGFSGGNVTVFYKNQRKDYFAIKSITPGGVFDKAGFQPNDIPLFSYCRFGVLGKTNEAIFYTNLGSARDGKYFAFTVMNGDQYKKAIRLNRSFDTRKVEFRVFKEEEFVRCSE